MNEGESMTDDAGRAKDAVARGASGAPPLVAASFLCLLAGSLLGNSARRRDAPVRDRYCNRQRCGQAVVVRDGPAHGDAREGRSGRRGADVRRDGGVPSHRVGDPAPEATTSGQVVSNPG